MFHSTCFNIRKITIHISSKGYQITKGYQNQYFDKGIIMESWIPGQTPSFHCYPKLLAGDSRTQEAPEAWAHFRRIPASRTGHLPGEGCRMHGRIAELSSTLKDQVYHTQWAGVCTAACCYHAWLCKFNGKALWRDSGCHQKDNFNRERFQIFVPQSWREEQHWVKVEGRYCYFRISRDVSLILICGIRSKNFRFPNQCFDLWCYHLPFLSPTSLPSLLEGSCWRVPVSQQGQEGQRTPGQKGKEVRARIYAVADMQRSFDGIYTAAWIMSKHCEQCTFPR